MDLEAKNTEFTPDDVLGPQNYEELQSTSCWQQGLVDPTSQCNVATTMQPMAIVISPRMSPEMTLVPVGASRR